MDCDIDISLYTVRETMNTTRIVETGLYHALTPPYLLTFIYLYLYLYFVPNFL